MGIEINASNVIKNKRKELVMLCCKASELHMK